MMDYTVGMSRLLPDDLLPDGFELFVQATLAEHPAGLDEFSLIRALAQAFPDSLFAAPDALRDPLQLFQTHFLLFHALYRLSDRLLAQQQELEVHAMRIRLLRRQSGPEGVRLPDPLRSYYLDWAQWASTHSEDVERLLQGYRQGPFAVARDEVDEALALFGVAEPVTARQIKQRYRALVSEHHPDRGGDTGQVQSINAALLILQRYYGRY
ncbi:DNA-J related domain-containing protein [Halopseudomonas pelagia]|uniref:DNA-J related domain-containing protein n=1 Tax=Halopseudomonas pelagia TaxID=553151 RepID=UPI0003A23525|nr:DNA-J related domain-containing protein [Halopseudomonas pelagia]|tara:strand:+ start:186 stop:818 length:633 start_codon:yes stop_codon:yes gene_type:complete